MRLYEVINEIGRKTLHLPKKKKDDEEPEDQEGSSLPRQRPVHKSRPAHFTGPPKAVKTTAGAYGDPTKKGRYKKTTSKQSLAKKVKDPIRKVKNWPVVQTRAFKKGYKKHKNNTRVLQELKKLLTFINEYEEVPKIDEYPPELRVHQITSDAKYPNTMWAHLQGQKIGVAFCLKDGKVRLLHLGTHQEFNSNWY